MAKNYPDTIPAAYLTEKLEDAYRRGWNHGHGLACHNVPALCTRYFTESEGWIVTDAENIRGVHASLCYEAEINSRCYSPFEFTAREFNNACEGDDSHESSEQLWDAFEAGTNDAIAADLSEYDDESYGIETVAA